MNPETLLTTLRDLFHNASVRLVYGDPVTAHGKTIIPVARVAYGMGAGGGQRQLASGGATGDSGGGGGGGANISPVGVIEITPEQTRFLRLEAPRKLAISGSLGFLLGLWMGKRRARRNP